MALTILAASFAAFLLLGVPVAFAIGLSALCTVLWEGLPLAVVFQRMTSGMNIFSFLAIPFFIFAGELMLEGGIADRVVRFARNLVGHIRGGLGMSNVVACTLFGGVSGSAVADVSAMGSVMIPMMKKEGYHADYAVNVTTHAALVGVLMPTSHNMIIFSLAAGGKVSIAALILAGLLPAAILTVCNLAAAYLVAIRRGYPAGVFPGWDTVWLSLAAALPGLAVVAIIIVGILSGVFTATESAAVAVIYALVLTAFVHRSLHLAKLPQGRGEGRENDRRGAAPDRGLQHLRLSHQPVRSRGDYGQDALRHLDRPLGHLPSRQRASCSCSAPFSTWRRRYSSARRSSCRSARSTAWGRCSSG